MDTERYFEPGYRPEVGDMDSFDIMELKLPEQVKDRIRSEKWKKKIVTIGDYFVALCSEMWSDPTSFKGKYGFGDSDWQMDLYLTLAYHGLVQGSVEDGVVFVSGSGIVKAGEIIQKALDGHLNSDLDW